MKIKNQIPYYLLQLLGAILIASFSFGQTVKPVTFKAPEAAAFDRRIETPVSYFTGVPNISLPIYTIKMKDVELPISIDYHAGGIRVDEEATWVGLGWSLSYGGTVSRKMRGMPDEQYFMGRKVSRLTIEDFAKLPHTGSSTDPMALQRNQNIVSAKSSRIDFMPDEFYYSVLGYSGRFMYNQKNDAFVLFPKEDIKIQYDVSDYNPAGYYSPNYRFNTWNVKLPNGIQAIFGGDGYSSESPRSQAVPAIGTWLPLQITNVYNENISFYYQHSKYTSDKFQSEVQSRMNGISTSMSKYNYDNGLISSINFPGGSILFTRQSRRDLPSDALKTISVFNDAGKVIKTIDFCYSYFAGSFNNPRFFDYVSDDYKHLRLKLDSVKINDFTSTPLVYRFDYYYTAGMNAPSKYSYAQDFWGYFNGESNSQLPPLTNESWQVSGASRWANTSAQIFSLKSIQYPEGGKTEYIYENNTAVTNNFPSNLLKKGAPFYVNSGPYFSVIGIDRSTSYNRQPDNIDQYGNRYFTQRFTLPANAVPYASSGGKYRISCMTDIGCKPVDLSYKFACEDVNVEYTLEKIETNGSKTLVRSYKSKDCNSQNAPQNFIEDFVPMETGKEYLMTMKLTYRTTINIKEASFSSFAVNWQILQTNSTEIPTEINVGGLRVKQINIYEDNGKIAIQKKYSYTRANSSTSSGKLFSWPLYVQYTLKGGGNPTNPYDVKISANSVAPMQSNYGSCMGYQYVTEETVNAAGDQKLRTSYEFSFDDPGYDFIYKSYDEAVLDPMEWKRGKLLSIKHYNNDKVLKEENYIYNSISPHLSGTGKDDYVEEINTDYISWQALRDNTSQPEDFYDAQPNGSGWWNYGYDDFITTQGNQVQVPYFKRYSGFSKPATKTVITYDNAGSLAQETQNYYYEKTPQSHQVSKTIQSSSKGNPLQQIYKYAGDFSGTAVYDEMVNRNMLAQVVEQTSFNNSQEISRTRSNYGFWNNKGFIALSTLQKSFRGAALQQELSYDAYDIKGNLLQLTGKDGIKESYLWGYNSTYPVAKVMGIDYSSAQKQIATAVLNNPSNDDGLRTELSKLRSIPGAVVSSYTYTPLLGLTSETDMNGKTTYYTYDGLNRLNTVRDNNKNIIRKFCYNYTGQQEECISIYKSREVSGLYTKNNCVSGAFPGVYTYIVPKGKYTSSTSQEDADRQAVADLNANGQTAANNNAGCYVEELIDLTCIAQTSNGFSISLINKTTNKEYVFVVNPGGGIVGKIPRGYYDATITPTNNNGYFNYGISSTVYAPGATKINTYRASNVNFDCASCAYFYITAAY